MKPHKRKKKSEETMEIFVLSPMFRTFKVKSELEDLCFQYIEPELYAELKKS